MNAILLDFGGTVDTGGVHWSVKFYEAYREEGISLTESEFDAAYSRAEKQMCSGVIAPEDGLRKTLEMQVTLQLVELGKGRRARPFAVPSGAGHRVAERCMNDVLETIRLHVSLLRRWSRHYNLALVSNFYGNLLSVVRGLGIAEYFGAIIDSTVAGVRKPDPRIFGIALEVLDCPPEKALVVGDSYDRDVAPAKSMGCRTAWLQRDLESMPRGASSADFVVSSLMGLDNILTERIVDENRT